MALIEFKNATKQYFTGLHVINALDGASFEINEGEFVVVLGPSGAGKSTMLNLLGVSILVSFLFRRKINKLNMVEALKGVE